MTRFLRSFFAAVFTLLLGAASAFGTDNYTITKTNSSGVWGAYSATDKTLTIKHSGSYSFSNFTNLSIDNVIIADPSASDVTILLPGPTAGKWNITFPLNTDNRTKLTIAKSSSSAAIVVDNPLTWTLSQDNDLVLDVPLKAGDGTLALTLTVGDAATATFTENADILASRNEDLATGYTATGSGPSSYTINAGGELIIRNASALRGSNLTIASQNGSGTISGKKATLTLDIIDTSTLDLRGVTGSASYNLEASGATLNLDGTLYVSNDITLLGKISGYENTTFTKAGRGTLTLANSGTSSLPSIADNLATISIDEGALVFASQRTGSSATWGPTGDNPIIRVGPNASFTAHSSTIIQAGGAITFDVKGSALFKTHAVLKMGSSAFDEIFPYENYINTTNTLKINAVDTVLDVAKGGKIIVDGGFLAAGVITGGGAIQIDGSELDKAALILTSPDNHANYSNFTGSISGTNANVGLYSTSLTPYGPKIFRSADVTIDNLLVYGSANLTIDATTNLDGVRCVWLRSNRPGAANFTSGGSINTAIASAQLSIGSLNFAPLSAYSSDIFLDGLKIDGTASLDDTATISVLSMDTKNFGLNVYLSGIQLYANRGEGLDFTSYVNPSSGIYSLRIDGSAQPSRFYIDGNTLSGDGLQEDTGTIYQVQIEGKSDVHFTGTGDFYPLAKNNSLLVKSCAKLEIDRGAIIDGNVKFVASANTLVDLVGVWVVNGANLITHDGWYSSEASGYTIFSTRVGPENSRTPYSGEFAVKVTGDIVFDDSNVVKKPAVDIGGGVSIADGGFVVIRLLPDEGVFTSDMTTTKQRFMIIGSTGEGTTCELSCEGKPVEQGTMTLYLANCQPAFETKFTFRPLDPKSLSTPENGILFESSKELAIIDLGEASFLEGGEDFGRGDGYNFTAKIPFTVSIQGEQAELNKEFTTASGDAYYIKFGVYKWYFKPYAVFLKFDSNYYLTNNVPDFGTLQQFTSSDIAANISFDFSGTEPYIKISGTSYSDIKPVTISVALYLEQDYSRPSTLTVINSVLPAFRDYSLIREGFAHGDQYSTAFVEALPPVDVTEKGAGSVSFTVSNFGRVNNNSSLPAFIIPDENGQSVTVSDVVLILYDDTNLTQTTITSGFTISSSGSSSTIVLPISELGDTGGTFDAVKMLSVRGTRTVGTGTITTQPVSYTLHSENYASGSKAVSALTKTVRKDQTVSASYTISEGELAGPLKYIPYNVPSWLKLSTVSGTISYTTGSLLGVTSGKYDVSILAYSGENSTSSPHKLYTFSITITDLPAPHEPQDFSLVPSSNLVSITLPARCEVNLVPVGAQGAVSYGADVSWVTFSGDIAVFSPLRAGSWDVTITATDGVGNVAGVRISVRARAGFRLRAPSFAAITLPGTAQLPLSHDNAMGAVYYSANQSWAVFSGDTVLLAPAAPGSWDLLITAIDYGSTPPAVAGAKISVTASGDIADGTSHPITGPFTLTAAEVSRTITLPEAVSITLTPRNSIGAVTYAANQAWVTFRGDTATFAPVEAGTYTVIITATDAGRSVGGQASVTISLTVFGSTKFTLSADETSITVRPSGGARVNLRPENARRPITYGANYEWVKFEGDAAIIAPPVSAEGVEYGVVITAVDGAGSMSAVRLTVKAEGNSGEFRISADKGALTIPSGGVGVVKMSAVNALGGVRYEGSYEWVKFEGNAAIIAPPEAGTYSLTITARDAAGRSASVEVRVTLEAAGSFLLFADPTYLELRPSEAGTVTLTALNASGDVRYTASEEWVTFAGNAAEIRPVEAGFYEVRITARDAAGHIAEVRIAVRVEAWEGEFSLSVPSSVEMVTTSTTVLAVSVQAARGEVSYSAEVSPALGLEVHFEGVDAVYLTAEAAGTYTVRITARDGGRQEANTAAATITVNAAPGRGTADSTGGGCGTGFGTITLGALVLLRVKRHKH